MPGILVTPGDRIAIGAIALTIGAVNETVTVTAEATRLQTESGETSFTITNAEVQNLPFSEILIIRWMHARRYVIEALESDESHMGPALHPIARPYAVEERDKALTRPAERFFPEQIRGGYRNRFCRLRVNKS